MLTNRCVDFEGRRDRDTNDVSHVSLAHGLPSRFDKEVPIGSIPSQTQLGRKSAK
jgi:hypothetical protein